MGKPRSTGNELFDIFWKEYPPRINGAGMMEKKGKKKALAWFETHKPTEEDVFDMLAWIKKDKDCRAKSSGHFYSPPADAIVFLNQERWVYDEVGEVATDSQRYEKKRSETILSNNVQGKIDSWSKVIHERSIDELRSNPQFMAAYKSCSEFRAWVQGELPDRKPPQAIKPKEAPPPKPEPVKRAPVTRLVMPSKRKPETVAIQPPEPTRVDRFKGKYRETVALKKRKFPLL